MRYVTRASIVSTHGERNAPALHALWHSSDRRGWDYQCNYYDGPSNRPRLQSGCIFEWYMSTSCCQPPWPHKETTRRLFCTRWPHSSRKYRISYWNNQSRLLARGSLNDVPIASSSGVLPEHFRAWIPTRRPFRPKCRSFWSIYHVEWSPTLMLTFDNHRL